ncbi:MAG TPA: hypothetical protein VGO57_05100 [Verrucomicrobiae bacterium]|jgi:hypothetical protein
MPGNRIKINSLVGCLILSGLYFACTGAPPVSAADVTLEDDSLRVVFDSRSGALTQLENKRTHWVMERRPELGVSFRLFAPLPERRWNPVLGTNQVATEVKKISDHEIHLQWKNLDSENGGVLPMALSAAVTLTNGVLTFNATLENNSALTVESIDYPYFGDLNAPKRATPLTVRVMTNNAPGKFKSDEIYPHFANEKGYWGVFWPLKTREVQASRFCLITAANEGLLIGITDPSAPYRMQYTFEQHPGLISSINNLVPAEDEIAGTPVHLEFRICHFIFAAPHTTTNLAPILLRSYQGDWHSGIGLDK